MERKITVPLTAQGKRLDKFLCEKLNFISRTKLSSLIVQGKIYVDREARKPGYRLKRGEEIALNLEEEKPLLKPFNFYVKIIYEDQDLIVVDKPSGLIVHPPQPGYNKTLVNALLYMEKNLSTINPFRAGVVHRLDKETSGVMVLAKNNASHLHLVKQFQERKVKKEYRAVCWGKFKKEQLMVNLPIARDKKSRLKMRVSFLKAKRALTEIITLEHLRDASFLCLKPFTGRMHQIRVHLNFLGYPIVGDKKYGIKDNYKEMFLHSHRLGFYHPRSEELLEFESPLPERFKSFIAQHRLEEAQMGTDEEGTDGHSPEPE